MKNRNTHSGQVALIMVLIMTVISAVAVSVASRSTVETRVQQMDSENAEAMLAAQSGLERAVVLESPISGSIADKGNYAVTVATEGTNGVISEKINPGQTLDINLEGAVSLTGANVYWKPASSTSPTSIFISNIRDDRTIDYAYDSLGINGFTRVNSGGNLNGIAFNYVTPSPIPLTLGSSRSLRITVYGGAAFLGVEPVGGLFPTQTRNYRAVGGVDSGDTVIKYGIEYKESATNQLPSVFDYALFSSGSIIQ